MVVSLVVRVISLVSVGKVFGFVLFVGDVFY